MQIFPHLKQGLWARINLNEESKKTELDFTNPQLCLEWIESIHQVRGVSYSYGGFLENRSNLWKNHYNRENSLFVHLGMDYNVPQGTKVTAPHECVVVDIFYDKDNSGGWGKRVLLKSREEPLFFIYGHLKQDNFLKLRQIIKPNDILGEIGDSSENGGWYPHLHVQVMTRKFIGLHRADLKKIDGYCAQDSKLALDVLNPELFIS